MSEDNTEEKPVDKAAEAVGAGEKDFSESEGGVGNPEPKDEPKPEDDKSEDEQDTSEEDQSSKEDESTDEDEVNPDDEAELDTDAWGSTGDDVGDSVLALLQNSGISQDEAKSLLYDAVEAGDVTKVDRKALEAKVGKNRANLILAGAENFIYRRETKQKSIVENVHSVAGGEENWNKITAWANKAIPEAEISEYRSMIDRGGRMARIAAQDLASRFNEDGSNSTLNKGKEVQGESVPAKNNRALTRQQYVAEITAAQDSNAPEAVINEIRAARQRGRSQGI